MKTDRKSFPELILYSIPFFFLFIFIEIGICWSKGTLHFYSFNDTINSLSQGMFQQIFNVIIKNLSIIPYAYVYENFAIVHLEETWGLWIVAFIGVE